MACHRRRSRLGENVRDELPRRAPAPAEDRRVPLVGEEDLLLESTPSPGLVPDVVDENASAALVDDPSPVCAGPLTDLPRRPRKLSEGTKVI